MLRWGTKKEMLLLQYALKQVKATTLIIGAPYANVEVAKANFEKQYNNLANKTIAMANISNHFYHVRPT